MHYTGAQETKINWKKDVMPFINEKLKDFNLLGIIPNFKTMFYALVLSNVIPNTQYHYRYLGKFMYNSRLNGKLSGYSFTADIHRSKNFGDEYLTAKEYINKIAYYIKRRSTGKCLSTINKNPFQSDHYVEVWLEKYSLYNNFKSLLKDSDVRVIIPSKKFSGITDFVNENLERLKICNNNGKHKKIHIRYFGDLDSYYGRFEEIINKKFQSYNSVVDFKRLAITIEQVEKFQLPKNPNAKIIRRLSNNPKRADLLEKYGNIFQIELECFLAYDPEIFKKLIMESTINDDFSDCQTLPGIL